MENQILPETEENFDIAIIGLAGRFPGAHTLSEFWQNLCQGVESITFLNDDELIAQGADKSDLEKSNYVKAASLVDDIEYFDASFFGYSPKEAKLMDPQHRLFLECAHAALEDAGYDPEKYDGSIGVYGGASMSTYLYFSGLLPMVYHDQIPLLIGNDKDFLTTRVSYKLNLDGPSINIQTACSTSLVAVHVACQNLINNECDIALAGGASLRVPSKIGYFYTEGGMVSPDGHCRPFDKAAQGTIFGSGVGLVVLKRLSEAVADGDNIYAVIKGSAVNNDGSSKAGFTAPSVEKQSDIIRAALSLAEVDAGTISYVEAHGTATPLGDPIEIRALTQAYRRDTDENGYCAIGSVKSNIGHLDAAAGITGLIKVALALKNKKIPPTLHYENPNPNIDFAQSPFYVNNRLIEWPADRHPRRAGITSLGVGGTNAHAILEEAPRFQTFETFKTWHLIPVSAKTPDALDNLTDALKNHLINDPNCPIEDIAFTLQQGRRHFDCRRAIVCVDNEDAVDILSNLKKERILTNRIDGKRHEIIFMFSGQGSQYVNMCRDLYDEEPVFQEYLDKCSELFEPHLNIDLRDLLYPDDSAMEMATDQISQTASTQPALFAIEYSLAKLFIHFGVTPSAMVGHSIGEYVAACLSGVFSLEDAVKIVAARGRLMQSLPKGDMIAVQLPEEKVKPYLSSKISLSVINSGENSVLSGRSEDVEELRQLLKENGVESTLLRTSHAFHSHMMDPILEQFAVVVNETKRNKPLVPFMSNVTGTWITDEQAKKSKYWTDHIRRTVKFYYCAGELLSKYPRGIFLEVGPGKVLTQLVMRHPSATIEHIIHPSTRHPVEKKDDVQIFLTTLSRLWLNGNPIQWSNLYSDEKRRRVSLPTYPFEKQRHWLEFKRPEASHLNYSESHVQNLSQDSVRTDHSPSSALAEDHPAKSDSVDRYDAIKARLLSIFSEIWGGVLDDIPDSTTFLEMGFDSLSLAQAANLVSSQLKVNLTFEQLMESQSTINLLTRYVRSESGELGIEPSMSSSEPLSVETDLPYPSAASGDKGELTRIREEIERLSRQVAQIIDLFSAGDKAALSGLSDALNTNETQVFATDSYGEKSNQSQSSHKFQELDEDHPPVEGASIGRDPQGNPGWYIEDPRSKGKYLLLKKIR